MKENFIGQIRRIEGRLVRLDGLIEAAAEEARATERLIPTLHEILGLLNPDEPDGLHAKTVGLIDHLKARLRLLNTSVASHTKVRKEIAAELAGIKCQVEN